MSSAHPRTALISWAHRNVGWSDAEAEDWIATVVRFASILIENGVDAELDLWHEGDTSIDWTRWGQQQVRDRDLVVVVISAAWKERWEGTNSPKQGAGAVAEADVLKGRFNTNQAEFQRRTILVLLPGVGEQDIPFDLHRLNRVHVQKLDDVGVASVVRLFNGTARYPKPELRVPAAPSLKVISSWREEADSLKTEKTYKQNQYQEPHVKAAFWFAVAHPKPVVDRYSGEHLFDVQPGQWQLALEELADGFLVQSQDGRLGLLRDTANIERG